MKINVLGTAAATSFPLPFCKCDICENSRKNNEFRKRASILINDDLLIDMGPDSITSIYNYGIDSSNIKYLLQTHSHSDHFDAGIFVTRHKEYATKNSNYLEIICSQGTFNDMNKKVLTLEPTYDLKSKKVQEDMNFGYTSIKHDQVISVGNYKIHAIDSLHDPSIEALIYIINYDDKNILYATDLLMINEQAWNILKQYKFNVIFIDQTYGKGFNAGGHTDAGMIASYVSNMKSLNIIDDNTLIYATHLSHEGNNIQEIVNNEANKYGYKVALDGMEIVL